MVKLKRSTATKPTTTPTTKSTKTTDDFYTPNKVGLLMFLYGPAGIGKTSFLAAGNSLFIYHPKEAGIEHLKKSGMAPNAKMLEPFTTEQELYDRIVTSHSLMKKHSVQNLVIESGTHVQGILETACCETHFKGDWSNAGYLSYQAGPQMVLSKYWPEFTDALKPITEDGLNVFITGHTATKSTPDPFGTEFQRYVPTLHERYSWSYLKGIFNIIGLMQKTVNTKVHKGKIYADDGSEPVRLLQIGNSVVSDAKNWMGLPDFIDLNEGDGTPQDGWNAFSRELKAKGYDI